MKLTQEQAERLRKMTSLCHGEVFEAVVEDVAHNVRILARLDWEGSGVRQVVDEAIIISIMDRDPVSSFMRIFRLGVTLGLYFAEQELQAAKEIIH